MASLRGEQKQIVLALLETVQKAAPQASLSIKWSQPVFEHNGPFCYAKAYTRHVNLGFWRGKQLVSGKGVLQSGGIKMAHMKLMSLKDIHKATICKLVKEAAKLNETMGNPTHK